MRQQLDHLVMTFAISSTRLMTEPHQPLNMLFTEHCPRESNSAFVMSENLLILRRAHDHSLENLHELQDFVVLDLPLWIGDADDVIGKLCKRLELAVTYVLFERLPLGGDVCMQKASELKSRQVL